MSCTTRHGQYSSFFVGWLKGYLTYMKLKFTFILICLFAGLLCKAQIQFIDEQNKLPIPSVNVYDGTGGLIGFTNKNGVVRFLDNGVKKQKLPLAVTVQHISYETKSISLASLDGKQMYSLAPRPLVLNEVAVNTKPKEVVVLKGYFRSLETFNHQHKYFADGIVEFFIPLKKGKTKYRMVDYRVFIDSTVVKDYNAKMGPFFQIPRFTEIDSRKLADRLNDLVKENDRSNRIRLLKKGNEVGYLTTDADRSNVQLYLDKVLPDTVVNEKLFSLEAKTFHEVTIENYNATELNSITPFNLTALYQNIVASLKRKKEYGHIPCEMLNEFYIMESRYITEEEYKSNQKGLMKSIYTTPQKSNCKTRFWEKLEDYHIPVINDGLAKQLGEDLQLIH